MPRYRLIVEYDGTPFVGWQRQDNGPSVQAALEDAVLAFAGQRVRAFAGGRTDAGVHALGQCVHLDLARPWPEKTVADALNAHLRPLPVAVLSARAVDSGFDARFSARKRCYRYRILNRRAPPALERRRVWHRARVLDAQAMAEAARLLLGRHDFSSFRAAECQARSPVKTLDRLDVVRRGDEIVIEAEARSFLHHQVRAMVGTLARVGEGKWDAGDVAAVLEARDRARAGPNAPSCGLYLVAIVYD